MLIRPTISLKLSQKTNSDLAAFATTIEAGITGNANYATPSPTMIAFGTLISDFGNAVTAWGTVHNRGSHNDKLAVDTTRAALEDGITALKDYCQNTTPYDGVALASAGFDVRLPNSKIGILPMVQDLHQFISRTVPSGAVKIKFKRPLSVKQGAVNSYKILRSLISDISGATVIGVSTKTTFTDLDAANQPTNFYWVIPVGAAGDGVVSDALAGYPIGPIVS